MSAPEDAVRETIISIRDVTKVFPGVRALDSVSMDVLRGEVHVLLGENGAGKSTLVKLLAGVHVPDAGSIIYGGERYSPRGPRDAIQHGIRLIHQELNLLPELSVAENLYFERWPSRLGLVDYPELRRKSAELLDEVGLDVRPSRSVASLRLAEMQMVEIARALSADSRVLIMDEPTASLTSKEIDRLFEIILALKSRGVTIVYISHRLEEVFRIGDRFTVLRNGAKVDTRELGGAKVEDIVRLMVGHDLAAAATPFASDVDHGREVLELHQVRPKGAKHAVSLSVRAREVVGIAGLVGSGRSELLRGVFGADRIEEGEIRVNGSGVRVRRPADAVRAGISFITENRKEEGLVLPMSCAVNLTLANLREAADGWLLNPRREKASAQRMVDQLSIRLASIYQPAVSLSGGNQQKVVVARWLLREAKVLLVDEPTRGIDVGARHELYGVLADLARAGKAILVVSSDLAELMAICHRIAVMSDHKLVGIVERQDFEQEQILNMAFEEYTSERKSVA